MGAAEGAASATSATVGSSGDAPACSRPPGRAPLPGRWNRIGIVAVEDVRETATITPSNTRARRPQMRRRDRQSGVAA
ncbi:MAG: hypothetical protein O9972_33385 [Burkholderiales bacterium]|nr:hypothetical protein [Burkholderiales bacterium]